MPYETWHNCQSRARKISAFGPRPDITCLRFVAYHGRMPLTLDHLRRYAIARSLFKPTTLMRAIEKLGFVQADPIRAPARAQDLTLRHRVIDYRAGELERRYPRLALEEEDGEPARFLAYVAMALIVAGVPAGAFPAALLEQRHETGIEGAPGIDTAVPLHPAVPQQDVEVLVQRHQSQAEIVQHGVGADGARNEGAHEQMASR